MLNPPGQRQGQQQGGGQQQDGHGHTGGIPKAAEQHRRQGAATDGAGVEHGERLVAPARPCQVRDCAVQHRRRAVQRQPQQRQHHHQAGVGQVHRHDDQHGRGELRGPYRFHHADARTEVTAQQFAEGAADEQHRQRQADARRPGALGLEQKRQEREETHAHGAVQRAGHDQRTQAARRAGAGARTGGFHRRRRSLGACGDQPPQQACRQQPEYTQQGDTGAPTDDRQQQPDQPRDQGLADIAAEVVLRQRLFDASAGLVRIGDQRRGQRVLRTRAEPAQQQCQQQHAQPTGLAGQQVGQARQRRATYQQAFTPPARGSPAGQ